MSNPFPSPKPLSPEAEQARIKQQTEYGFASQLLESEPFAWMMRECLDTMINAEEKTALDISSTDEEAKLSRHKRDVLLTVRQFAAKRQESTRSAIQEPKQ